MPYSLASKTGVMLLSRNVRASVPKDSTYIIIICHMPTGTRARLPCEAKKEQQCIHHNMHRVDTVKKFSQFSNNQTGKILEKGVTGIEQSTSS